MSGTGLGSLYVMNRVRYFMRPMRGSPSILMLNTNRIDQTVASLLLFVKYHIAIMSSHPRCMIPRFFSRHIVHGYLPLRGFGGSLPLSRCANFVVIAHTRRCSGVYLRRLQKCLPACVNIVNDRGHVRRTFRILHRRK